MKQRYRILVVHDDWEVLDTLTQLLQKEGYIVRTTQNALEALEIVKNDKYHIVMINIAMPRMDGLELLREIKSYDPMTQAIMMAENSTMDAILSSLEYGANDYIRKPIENKAYILNAVENSVQKLERWRAAIQQIVR